MWGTLGGWAFFCHLFIMRPVSPLSELFLLELLRLEAIASLGVRGGKVLVGGYSQYHLGG